MCFSTRNACFIIFSIAAFAALGTLAGLGNIHAAGPIPRGDESLTWKPNRPGASPGEYAGAQACTHCHSALQATQRATDMASAAMWPAECSLLRQHPSLRVEQPPYTYSLEATGKEITFSVSDGQSKITAPVYLVVGAGSTHQYYLVQHNGVYYQIPVSYDAQKGQIHWMGNPSAAPASLEAALGSRMTAERIQSCLQCHGTLGGGQSSSETGHFVPGINCEACHGPGARHVAAMRAGKRADRQVINPARMTVRTELEFCGDCHHYQDVKSGSLRGIRNVMSQSYRLEKSRCWLSADKRSRCTFCHDPHRPAALETGAYDTQCLSCHASQPDVQASAAQPGKACPVSKQNCAGCHMPRVEVPGSGFSYTDHLIRIVRAGAAYPE